MKNLSNMEIPERESTDIIRYSATWIWIHSFPLLVFRTYPEWSSPLLSVDCVYIQTFEELSRVRIKLSEKETEAQFFNTEMKTKWEKLRKRQLDFLADVRKYDHFFSENERKFRRVSAKIDAELVTQKYLEMEIDLYEKRNEYLSRMLLKMEDSVTTLTPYHTFVSTLVAVDKAPDYGLKDVDSLINLIVSISQNTLHDKFSNILFQYENLRSQMQQRKMVKQSELSEKANDLFHTKKLLKNGKEDLIFFQDKLEKKVPQNENEKSKLMTHHNIYRLLREWKEVFHLHEPSNGDEEISYIGDAVDKLRCMVKEALEIFNKSNLSHEVDSSFMTIHK